MDRNMQLFQQTLELATEAFGQGNDPFGSILVDEKGNILMEQMNTVGSGDPTAHDTIELIRKAVQKYSPEQLGNYTVYAAMEPCCMCTGAAFWANVGAIRFLMSEKQLGAITGPGGLDVPSREVIQRSGKDIDVHGPFEPLLQEMEGLMRQWVDSWGRTEES